NHEWIQEGSFKGLGQVVNVAIHTLEIICRIGIIPVRDDRGRLQRIDFHKLHIQTYLVELSLESLHLCFGVLRLHAYDLYVMVLAALYESRKLNGVRLGAGPRLNMADHFEAESAGEISQRVVRGDDVAALLVLEGRFAMLK